MQEDTIKFLWQCRQIPDFVSYRVPFPHVHNNCSFFYLIYDWYFESMPFCDKLTLKIRKEFSYDRSSYTFYLFRWNFYTKTDCSKVIAKGLYGFSLTDHDTVDGILEILAMDLPDDLKFIPGIEISCDALHREIHVLGYGINYKDQQLNHTLNMLRDKRFQRNLDMIELFQKDGYPITLEKLQMVILIL